MTLIELLVAFVILLMLVAALVTLTTRSLETWNSGETRKDMYDRAQVALDLIAADLRNLYGENEVYLNGTQPLLPAALICDLDKKNNRPCIRFVRAGNPALMRVPAMPPSPTIAPSIYGPTWEIAYVMDPDPLKNNLYRGVRAFDRRKTGTLFNPIEYASATDDLFKSSFTQVESGILYVGFRFWTQYTTTWDESVPVRKVTGPRGKESCGPEKRWDSTRADRSFYFYRRSGDLKNQDFVYPEIIQVSVTVEQSSPELHGVKLGDGMDERSPYIRLTHARGMPDGPSMVKIDQEWIEYADKTTNELVTLKRGQRGTKPAPHAVGSPVHFGETFITEVRLPVWREAQEP